MKRTLQCRLLAASLIIFTGSANAILIRDTDYVSDTDTGYNWVLGNTANITAALGQGGDYEGWRIATETDIVTLFDAAGGSGNYTSARFFDVDDWSPENNGLTETLASYFGYSRGGGRNIYTYNRFQRREVVGLIDSNSGEDRNYTAGTIDWAAPNYLGGDYVFSSAVLSGRSSRYWLVQDNSAVGIPEPAPLALLAMGLLLIGGTKLHFRRSAEQGKQTPTTLA